MKTKSIFCSALLFIAAYTANGQWTGTPTSATVYTTNTAANVGFGTTAPAQALEVARTTPLVIGLNRLNAGGGQKSEFGFFKNGVAKWTIGTDMWDNGTNSFYVWNGSVGSVFQINSSGNVGIGAGVTPVSSFDLASKKIVLGSQSTVSDGHLEVNGSAGWGYNIVSRSSQPLTSGNSTKLFVGYNTHASREVFIVHSSGKVEIGPKHFIGSSHTDYSLSVDGKVIAPSFYALQPAYWADFVFDENYKLTPLEEVEKFVKENKHLPEIPSATEVLSTGIDMQKMDALLLMKVEELTLHLIEMQKEMKGLKAENATLKTTLEEITK